MKVCFIVGADNIFFERYCEYLVTKGHDIHVIPIQMPEKKLDGVIYHNFGNLKPRRVLSQLHFYTKVRMFVTRTLKPDVLSSFGINQCGWLGAFTGWRPSVLHVMGSDLFLSPIIKKILNLFAIMKTDCIISESEEIRKITSKYRSSIKKNYVIQFGVRLDLFKPNLNVRGLRENLKIKEDGIVIISPRNNHPIYNHDIVIKAFEQVMTKVKNDCYLLIKAQNAQKQAELEKLAKDAGVLEKVRFYGFVPLDELPLYYNLAQICISVPSSDSVPVTLQEAMACGVPPVISDLPAVREWVQNEINGYVVPVRDEDVLAETIIKLIKDRKEREKFIKYNLDLVREKADFLENMNKLDTIYKSA